MSTSRPTDRPPVVYIAGPYSAGDPVENTRRAMDVWHNLYSLGLTPICPHWSMQQHMVTHLTWDEWLDYDERLIDRCDALYRMPGVSRGADREVAYAQTIGVPVFDSVATMLVALRLLPN